jgi:hypothetical protein
MACVCVSEAQLCCDTCSSISTAALLQPQALVWGCCSATSVVTRAPSMRENCLSAHCRKERVLLVPQCKTELEHEIGHTLRVAEHIFHCWYGTQTSGAASHTRAAHCCSAINSSMQHRCVRTTLAQRQPQLTGSQQVRSASSACV